ncbi:hypothetical protein BX257_0600 [Streptomyces sp. 3212.3]|nr:hypothetical protein BX257_0600 [Streptomyces sp. 3212.3]
MRRTGDEGRPRSYAHGPYSGSKHPVSGPGAQGPDVVVGLRTKAVTRAPATLGRSDLCFPSAAFAEGKQAPEAGTVMSAGLRGEGPEPSFRDGVGVGAGAGERTPVHDQVLVPDRPSREPRLQDLPGTRRVTGLGGQ